MQAPKYPLVERALALARIDFAPSHEQPSALSIVVATIASIAGSLLADAALVAIGTAVFPSTKGYVHFQFHDYARLTIDRCGDRLLGVAGRDPYHVIPPSGLLSHGYRGDIRAVAA